MFVYKSSLLVFNRITVSARSYVFARTHTHSRCSFGHFLTKEGIQKFLYLNIAAHSPVDPFLSQPYQKEREEEKNQKKEREREKKKAWFINWEKWRTWHEGERKGECLAVEKYSSTEKRQQRCNCPALCSLAKATECLLISNTHHVVTDNNS